MIQTPSLRFTPKLPGTKSRNRAYLYRFIRLRAPERQHYNASGPVLWCLREIGAHGIRWKISYGCFMFTNPDDATAFRLRWGQDARQTQDEEARYTQ
jgi:hypothetical protein